MKAFASTQTLVLLTASLLGAGAFAQDLTLGTPSYGGRGCPLGTASATLSPDGTSVSVIFDAFSAQAGGGRVIKDFKDCSLELPVTLAPGRMARVLNVDYRGFAGLPRDSRMNLSVETRVVQSGHGRFLPIRKSFAASGEYNSDFFFSVPVNAFIEQCGGATKFQFITSLQVEAGRFIGRSMRPIADQAVVTLDSIDVGPAIEVDLAVTPCN
jgi:hypothetical protein